MTIVEHRFLRASLGVMGGTLLALFASWSLYARWHLGVKAVPGLGNYPATVNRLPQVPDGCFRFAVIGDPEEGLGVYRDLMRKASALGAAFVVIPGDVADRPTREAFELFNYEQLSLGRTGLPTFTAIGNHDKEPSHLFEKYYGPTEFHFVYADSLFIFADNNGQQESDSCGLYVSQTIARYRDAVSRVFVVVHRPITDFRKWDKERRVRSNSEYIFNILDTERVDVVIAAHLHGYQREEYKGTTLLVSGGGGGKLQSADAYYHMVLVDVDPQGITETVVRAESRNTFADDLRLALVVRLYPLVFGDWLPQSLLLMVGAALILACCWSARRSSGPGDAAISFKTDVPMCVPRESRPQTR